MCKTKYPELEQMVNALAEIEESGKQGRCKRIDQLQKICDKILGEYVIEIGEITIEPLRLETYYYHPGKFEDPSVHKKPQQKTFARLYLHKEDETELKSKGFGGVDICLSCGDYYLSFLVKNSRISYQQAETRLCKQIELNEELNQLGKKASEAVNVLVKKDKADVDPPRIFHTVRVNLGGKPFARELLASVREIEINKKDHPDYPKSNPPFFTWAKGFGAESMIAEYLYVHPEEAKDAWTTWWDGGVPGWVKKEWKDKQNKRSAFPLF